MMTARRMWFSSWRTLPGQVIAVQGAQGVLVEGEAGLALLLAKLLQEKLRQQADVSFPFAQRRQDDCTTARR